MKYARRRHTQRGFALVTVIMLIALATVSSLVLLDVISTDIEIAGDERRGREARLAAEGGLMEVLNDREILGLMPDKSSPGLQTNYTPGSSSRFTGVHASYGEMAYTAEIKLVRVAPMLESSHSLVRAVVYEIDVQALLNDRTGAGVEAEIYKVSSAQAGVVQPRMHAR